ncbi:hypothetical protein FPQ18DRAFT_309957 [Pyronema domesticum]|nr:hypothetical protein FPQ18DRAFT_309957 [Pyronema domesticum]
MQLSSNLLAFVLLVASVTAILIVAEADSGVVSVTDAAGEVPTGAKVPRTTETTVSVEQCDYCHGTPYDNGKWYPGKYQKRDPDHGHDNGKWYPGKSDGYRTGYDNGKWDQGAVRGLWNWL